MYPTLCVKRFGVSLPKEVAEAVESIAAELGVTRSEVVANAVQAYLESRRGHAEPSHQCLGVLMALSNSFSDLSDVVERHKEAILAYTHLHVEGKCLTIFVVRGDGPQVERLSMEVSKRSHTARYVPLV